MSKISIKQLEAFIRIAEDGSFRKAADGLNTTQPNISVRISNLEQQIGKTLMERDAGSVRLTSDGQNLLEPAQKVLAALEQFKVAAGNSELFEGCLRLGVTETIAHSWLGEFLNAFSEKFPQITIDLTVDLSATLSADLFNGAIDLALQSGPFKTPLPDSRPLGTVPLSWVASPSLHSADAEQNISDLSQFAILTHSRNTLPFLQLEKHFASCSENARLVPSTSLAACLQMTLQGIGIACLPMAIVQQALENKTLNKINYSWVPDALVFSARHLTTKHPPHHIREAAALAETIAAKHTKLNA